MWIRASAAGEVPASNAYPNCASLVTRNGGFRMSGSSGYSWSTDGSSGRFRAQSAPTWAKMSLISGDARAEQVEEDLPGADVRDLPLCPREVGRREAAEQPAVDQHQAVQVAIPGAAVEVPGRVRDRGRGAGGVATEQHPAPAGARPFDHAAKVGVLELQAPVGREEGVL